MSDQAIADPQATAVPVWARNLPQRAFVVLFGKTGSGKTSTAYDGIMKLIQYGHTVTSLEQDTPEVFVRATKEAAEFGLTQETLAKMFKHTQVAYQHSHVMAMPDLYFLGDLRGVDESTHQRIQIGINAASSRKSALATVHAATLEQARQVFNDLLEMNGLKDEASSTVFIFHECVRTAD
ncbi:ATPase, T2SS/T4P/T4SS family [Allopusillimonas ginsengisoli]|uniref:ATPase, T2SS/T4P/T4SS family n=1 Tax=Allopusillimonas ginsengisoli TaxID=453575 RepID=UPI0039C09D3E